MKRLNVEKHPFEPFVPNSVKYLILGSFPGKKFTQKKTENGWYYQTNRNQFWKILGEIYRVKLSTIEDKQELLRKLKIAMTDIILICKRSEDSNADKHLIKKTYNREAIRNILINNDIEKIFFTSKWVGAEFRENFKEIEYYKEMIDLPSPSPIFRRMSFEDKVNIYREVLPKNAK